MHTHRSFLSFHNLQERTPVQSDQSHTRGCLSTVNVGSDDLYDLCVPVLEDSATDEEEKTEKVEELVKIQGCRIVHKTFLQSSQPASPTAKTLRSPRIASSNHKEQMPYPNMESAVSLPGRFRVRRRILPESSTPLSTVLIGQNYSSTDSFECYTLTKLPLVRVRQPIRSSVTHVRGRKDRRHCTVATQQITHAGWALVC